MNEILPAIGKRESAAVALILAALSLVLLRPSIRGVDGVGNYVYLMSLLRDGDFDFSNEYAAFDLRDGTDLRAQIHPVSEATGVPANRYGIGCALFWAPTVGLVHGLFSLVDPSLANGLERPYEWAVGIGSAWWGCLGLWLLYLRLRRNFDIRASGLALAGIVFATPFCFYLWLHGSMSHAISFFVVVMAGLSLEKAWQAPAGLGSLMLGAWCGLLLMTRFQDLTWALVFGGALLAVAWTGRDESGEVALRPGSAFLRVVIAALLFSAGVTLAMLPQFAVWKILYGHWLSGPVPYLGREGGQLGLLPVHVFEVLFSQRGGVIAWHPILAGALAGWVVARRELGFRLFATLLAGFLAQLYLVSSWSMWWGGASFGNRFFISSFPLLAFGLAVWDRRFMDAGRKRLVPVLLVLLILWNAGLLIQYGSGMISREDSVGWGRVVINQFTEVPVWIVGQLR